MNPSSLIWYHHTFTPTNTCYDYVIVVDINQLLWTNNHFGKVFSRGHQKHSLQKLLLKIILRLYLSFSVRIALCPVNNIKYQFFFLYPSLLVKNKILYLQVITFTENKNSFDINIEKLKLHRATFFKICKCNISFNQCL